MRILSIIRKEFIHISRDFRTLVIVVVLPVVMLFLYGFAINMEIQNINVAVLDHDRTPTSRDLVREFEGSAFFTVDYFSGSDTEVDSLFAERRVDMALIILPGFAQKLRRGMRPAVQVIVDASDPNAAQAIRNYSDLVLQQFNLKQRAGAAIDISPAVWYNPALKSAYFFVPGLAALILIMISALLTSVAIVREKETGTMEQILVSPVRPYEIILGKVIPYVCLAFVDLAIILLIAHLVFQVPFVGSLSLLIAASFVFISVALSLGLFISTRAETQQVAMMMALMATMLPTVMLSGFIFPLSSLPLPLQAASYAVPARYFLVVIRGIMLKGNTLGQIAPNLSVLVGMAVVLLLVSVKKFKTRLEL